MFSGNTILGDGAVIMIIDPNGIAKALGASGAASHEIADETAGHHAHSGEQLTSLLVFPRRQRAAEGGALALVTRLEEIAADKIELSNAATWCSIATSDAAGGRWRASTSDHRLAADPGVRRRQALDGARGRRRSSTSSRNGSTSRSRAPATAFWLGRDQGPGHRGDRRRPLPADGVRRLVHPQGDDPSSSSQSVLLVDDSAFFRNMLAAGAQGRRLQGAPRHQRAGRTLRHCARGRPSTWC